MKDGFLKAAALSPALRVADCAYNTRQILTELRAAAARGVKLAVFPEFCLTGYTCGDLFLQKTLLDGALVYDPNTSCNHHHEGDHDCHGHDHCTGNCH